MDGHYQIIQKSFKKNLSALSTIMEKVALPRGYFPTALVNITSGFLKNHLRKRKSLIPLTVRFLLCYGIPNICCKKIFAGDEN